MDITLYTKVIDMVLIIHNKEIEYLLVGEIHFLWVHVLIDQMMHQFSDIFQKNIYKFDNVTDQ